ncbi:hypothetical protein CT0861_13239 [Colletotrichum tofieldiae]|uniref:HTH psq-type domain-containing protein n=1 Tax=Colletotrichum tofieldiae TaxID=708197 RepID=A0A166LVU2_9PEZI|nr:hypothetical protein CT0861_13239 [Colletotrichum tofieldiae]
MDSHSNESRIILIIKAIKKDLKLSVRKASSIYNIPEATLRYQRARRLLQQETQSKSIKITIIKEIDFHYDLITYKIWLIAFLINATQRVLDHNRQRTLYNANHN